MTHAFLIARSRAARLTRSSTYNRCVALVGYGAVAIATVGCLATAMGAL